jgi:hypothetical protein
MSAYGGVTGGMGGLSSITYPTLRTNQDIA